MKKILLIKRGALGDILMTTPLVRCLARAGYSVDYLVSESCQVALKDNIYLNKIYLVEDSYFKPQHILKFTAYVRALSEYDYVFVLDKHWYFSFLSRFVNASYKIGFCRDSLSKIFLDRYVRYNDVNVYQVDYYLQLASLVGLDYQKANQELSLFISLEDKELINNYILQHKLCNFAIIVNSGGNNGFEKTGIRMLPSNLAVDLIHEIATKYDMVLLLGSKLDYANYQEYIARLPVINILNVAGAFSLAQSAYLIAISQVFYTTDCGAMHLGFLTDCNVEMTVFCGPSNPKHIVPELPRVKVIWLDEDIYDTNYQLFGTIKKNKSYFMRLKSFEQIIRK